jgi:hypothetical protein
MKITKFWAKGYRSLRDVELDGLGTFNVFYGPNGSGKSNVLTAIDTFFRWLAIATDPAHFEPVESPEGEQFQPVAAMSAGADVLATTRDEDFFAQETTREIVLGASMTFAAQDPLRPPLPLAVAEAAIELRVELTLTVLARRVAKLKFSSLRANGAALPRAQLQSFLTWAHAALSPSAFGMVDAIRALPNEVEPVRVEATPDDLDPVLAELQAGRLKSALFAAKNLPRGEVRHRFEQMQELMAKSLGRPGFDVVRDPKTREIDLREMLPPPNPDHADVPLARAGLGVVQVYTIIATMLFARRRAIALEEPEAHLHAPTMGRLLRRALVAMVSSEQRAAPLLDQLFIATHSNLFDLDPKWFWDVSLANGETRVQRCALDEVDARHLYEPGPAKHALLRTLEYLDPEVVVFRHLADGRPVTAAAMCDLLRRDAAEADDYLVAVYGNAVRSVRRLAQATSKPEP